MATVQVTVLTVFTELPTSLPERVLLAVVSLSAAGPESMQFPLTAPLGGLLFVPAGILWATTYVFWIEPRLHGADWLKGLAFSIAPTTVSWFVVLPVLGAGPLRLWLDVGPLLAASEFVRHAIFGMALALSYPLLLLARGPWRGTEDMHTRPTHVLSLQGLHDVQRDGAGICSDVQGLP